MPIGYQYIVGISIGLIAAVFLYFNNRPVTYSQTSHTSQTNSDNDDFFETPENPCAICQDIMDNNSIQYLKCGHALHSACYIKYKGTRYAGKCPICRIDL